MRWPFKVSIAVVLVLIVIGVMTKPEPAAVDLATGAPVVTKYEYESLKTGMAYSDAVRVVGEAGEESSRVDLPGAVTVMYIWKNPDGSNMNAMFQNGGLITKAQFGLK